MKTKQIDFLVLDGPGHLQVIRLEDGQTHFEMAIVPPSTEAEAVYQTFTYRVVWVGAGSHPAIGFLIPVHFEGEPKHIAGWVFNKLVQGLIGTHPMGGRILLSLNFVVEEEDEHRRVFTAQATAHPVSGGGVVRLEPLATNESQRVVDDRSFTLLNNGRNLLRRVIHNAAIEALGPYIDSTVDQVLLGEIQD